MAKKKKKIEQIEPLEFQLWDRQEYDTDASFVRFHTFYLPQKTPRSLNRAYRLYRISLGREKDTKSNATAPGTWRKWYGGQNSSGKKIKGAKTWKQRASAYDEHMAGKDHEYWEQRAHDLREKNYEEGDALRKLGMEILEAGPDFIKETRQTIKGKKGKPNTIIITKAIDIKGMINSFDLGSKLQALSVGEPTERTETIIEFPEMTPEEWLAKREERIAKADKIKRPPTEEE